MKRFNRNDKKSVAFSFFVSVISGLLASLISVILFSLLISKNDISTDIIMYFWFPITIIGAAVGGLISGRISAIKGILSGIITSTVISVILLTALILFNGFSISITAFLIIPVSLITGTICSIISANFR